ncbi:MAG: hypothetical protein V3S14_08345, partial [Anaerolineae bacterium]
QRDLGGEIAVARTVWNQHVIVDSVEIQRIVRCCPTAAVYLIFSALDTRAVRVYRVVEVLLRRGLDPRSTRTNAKSAKAFRGLRALL